MIAIFLTWLAIGCFTVAFLSPDKTLAKELALWAGLLIIMGAILWMR